MIGDSKEKHIFELLTQNAFFFHSICSFRIMLVFILVCEVYRVYPFAFSIRKVCQINKTKPTPERKGAIDNCEVNINGKKTGHLSTHQTTEWARKNQFGSYRNKMNHRQQYHHHPSLEKHVKKLRKYIRKTGYVFYSFYVSKMMSNLLLQRDKKRNEKSEARKNISFH